MMLTRRRFTQLSGMAAGSVLLGAASGASLTPDVTPEIAPYTLEAAPKHHFRTVAYNGQVPGPLLRMRQGHAVRNDRTIVAFRREEDAEVADASILLEPVLRSST